MCDSNAIVMYHADCYCQDTASDSIEVSVHAWQEFVSTNDFAATVEEVGDNLILLAAMGFKIDNELRAEEGMPAEVRCTCEKYGLLEHLIPCKPVGIKNVGIYFLVGKCIDKEVETYKQDAYGIL